MIEVDANNTPPARTLTAGLWWNSPGLGALIGLCPLLAVSTTFAAGFALGIASLAVLCANNLLVSALAPWIAPRFRLAAFLLLIAALVTSVDLFFQAWWFDLHGVIGLFVPLIVINCLILTRAESFAAHHRLWPALLDALRIGLGFTVLLAGIGALREWLAPGLLVAALPAGAFFLLAALIALRQVWFSHRGVP